MDNQTLVEGQVPKKGRQRKKQLYKSIMQQMEFYFSDSNLSKDKFLLPLVQQDPEVDIAVFLKFNKIRKLTSKIKDIVKAINNSEVLEVSSDQTKVRRKTEVAIKENVDKCTLYIERIKSDTTHEWLASIFSEFGNVTYVSIPKYKHNKVNKGFAFVEFEKEQDATDALNYFESIGCKMSLLMPPEELCSIVTYEGNNVKEEVDGSKETEDEECNLNAQKKRKLSTEESEENRKKIKVEPTSSDTEKQADNVPNCDDNEAKRKKKSKKARKKLFKELGLQVLSKAEWKKIRNCYLDNQKAKMKQLKQFLQKKKMNKFIDIRPKVDRVEKLPDNLSYTPGVIVKVQLSESQRDLKSIKDDLKQHSTAIKYVDLEEGTNEGYLRFSDSESAEKFCSSEYKGRSTVLQGTEEEEYWKKIQEDRSTKFKKNQKPVRGREKLLKKAERLGMHIRFEDAD